MFQAASGGGTDAFVTEVAAGGTSLAYSTYAGGSGNDAAAGIALDSAGNAFVTGNTTSTDFPAASALQAACATALTGCDDAFALELGPGGTAAVYTTYLGGSAHDAGNAVAVDGSGNAYLAGATNSTDFPATPGVYQPACGSSSACGNAFVAEIGSSSGALQTLPAVVPFGPQTIGMASAPRTVTVTNSTVTDVKINGITASSGKDMKDGDSTCTTTSPLAGNASCVIAVTFSPVTAGLQPGTLTLTDSAPGSPQVVELSGTGVTSVVTLSPDSVSFSSQFVGTSSAPQTLTLTNAGSTALAISSVAVTAGSAFSETNNCGASLDAGLSCMIFVTFSPTASGTASATLTVTDNAASSPQTASLTGTGVSSTVSLSTGSINFGAQIVGTGSSTPQSVTVTNTGNASLTVTGVTLSGANAGDFALTTPSPCGASVAAAGTCTIQINFTPSAAGARAATLSIADNAADSPQTVALAGTGSDFQLSASPSSTSVHQGGSTTYTLTVTPLDGFTGTVNLSCGGAPAEASCTLSLPAANFTAGSPAVKVTVNIGTTGPGAAPPWLRWAPPGGPFRIRGLVWLLLAGAGLLAALAGRRGRRSWIVLASALLLVAFAASCGNTVVTKPTAGTPFGTYTLTLTGSSANLGHSTTVTLVVD